MPRLSQRTVEAMVEARGLLMTVQRRVTISVLESATHHPTAEQLLREVRAILHTARPSTLYYTLSWLKKEGMIREVYECGVLHFDPNTSPHHHFICRKCGKIEDVEEYNVISFNVDQLQSKLEKYEVTLRGVCGECNERN